MPIAAKTPWSVRLLVTFMFSGMLGVGVWAVYEMIDGQRRTQERHERIQKIEATLSPEGSVDVVVDSRLFTLQKVRIEGRLYYATISYRGDLLLTPAE